MSRLHAALALLLLAAPLSAQTTRSHRMGGAIYSGGPTEAVHRLRKGPGTSGGGASTNPPVSAAGVWDLGNDEATEYGGVAVSSASGGKHFASSSVPNCTYPFSVCAWVKPTTSNFTIVLRISASNTDTNESIGVVINNSLLPNAAVQSGGGAGQATGAVALTAGRWHRVVAVFASATSRSIYTDVETAGATNSTSKTASGLAYTFLGRNASDLSSATGTLGPVAFFPGVALSATQRAAFLTDACDLRLLDASLGSSGHLWRMRDATGADYYGRFNLTPTNSPTAGAELLSVRDLSGNGRHVRATTAPPTFSSSQGNGQGGGAFASASSQFLVFDGSVPTAAPLQVYLVGQSADITANYTPFFLGDKDSAADFWELQFAGTVGSDPTRWGAVDGSSAVALLNGYSANTNHILWGLEASATSRFAGRDGTVGAENTTDTTPDDSDRITLGARGDATPTDYLNGQIHYVILQTTSSTAGKTRIERFLGAAFAVTVP